MTRITRMPSDVIKRRAIEMTEAAMTDAKEELIRAKEYTPTCPQIALSAMARAVACLYRAESCMELVE